MFGVQNSKSFSMLILNKIFRVTVLLLILLLPSICAHTEENVETINDLVLSMCYMGAHWRNLANTIEPTANVRQ